MSRRTPVLISDRFDIEALAHLRSDPRVEVRQSMSPEPTAEDLRDTEILIIRSRTKITAALLAKAPALRLIVTTTSGFDHIDFEASEKFPVAICHTPEANAASAAELTWALVLACARRIPQAHRAVRAGDWSRETMVGTELFEKTYGVVGLGRVGVRVARMAQAFGMRVLAFDPYREHDWFAAAGAERVGLDEIMCLADVVSLHVPATIETQHLIRDYHLRQRPELILINTSRGTAIDESALCEALRRNQIRAAGLDVFEKEPLSRTSPLIDMPNVVLTPHLGATTHEAFARASKEAVVKVFDFMTSGESTDRLPPTEAWFACGFTKNKRNS